jgi:hypothetical protein
VHIDAVAGPDRQGWPPRNLLLCVLAVLHSLQGILLSDHRINYEITPAAG